jgi:hypothetical protein
MCRVVLELTRPLGVEVQFHAWQAGPSYQDYADKFSRAAKTTHMVSFYQSFWGERATDITEAIRSSTRTLFISPYVEHGGRTTSITPQGSALRPWDNDTITHFVTVAPLARRIANGRILNPSDRGSTDSEAVNFVAPSFHANGPGGTCPAASVAVACAAYLHAIAPQVPEPEKIIQVLRESSAIDRNVLVGHDRLSDEAVDQLESQVAALRNPAAGKQRKLDSAGVLNLYNAYTLFHSGN